VSADQVAPLSPRYDRDTTEFNRVIAFTDGVVAIAMTLLVLGIELAPPTADTDTASADVFELVADAGEQIWAFVLSFVIIGFYWANHHRFVSKLAAIDRSMMAWTLAFLLAIAFMPFASQLIGFYPGNEQAIALYAAWFVVFGLIDAAGYLLARARHLLEQEPSAAAVRFSLVARLIAPAVFAASIAVAYVISPRAAMWSWLLIWPLSAVLTRNPPADV
jgi:uncharacterized membrane protein